MEIDDILAEVTAEHHKSLQQDDALGGSGSASQDLQSLTRAWVAERVAPEILPYPADLMERVLDKIRRQIELVEEQTGNMDPKTNFQLIVIQTELERFKFLVRSFLRARIAKIDKFPLHTLTDPETSARLSESERQYTTAHQALVSSHYHASFLSQFPHPLQRLDDTAGGISMVDAPDMDTAVFCRVLKDLGRVRQDATDSEFDMRKGDVWVVRWSLIRDRVFDGEIELI